MTTDLPPEHASAWFDPLYSAADRDASAIPWAHMEPSPWVVEFLADNPGSGAAGVVGCGLGDDAEAAARAGYATTAFDVSEAALAWCRDRFPGSAVDYRVVDLLVVPDHLIEAFEAVIEVRTIQSLPVSVRDEAIDATASLVAPGGVLLVVALARRDGSLPTGLPWAVGEELRRFEACGLHLESLATQNGHFVARFSRI
ncbi:MAG: class I SAM-dependent methyltransferase [Acidimicrobiia bacterium]